MEERDRLANSTQRSNQAIKTRTLVYETLNKRGRITGLLHNLQKLNDHFRAGAHKHLTLAALLSIGDAL